MLQSFNESAKTLQLVSTGGNTKCLTTTPMASTGAFFGGPKPSVTNVGQCPAGTGNVPNTSQMTLSSRGEIQVSAHKQ